MGACLTLLRERAVGRRVRVHWPDEADRGPFAGTVAAFDAEFLTHAIAYDDGDVEPACRLWKETVHLGGPGGRAGGGGARDEQAGTGRFDRGVARGARATGARGRAPPRERAAEREPRSPARSARAGRPPGSRARRAGAAAAAASGARAKGMRRGVMTDEKRETKSERFLP